MPIVEKYDSDDPAVLEFGRNHGAALATFVEGSTVLAQMRGITEDDLYKISRTNLIALAAAFSVRFMSRDEFMAQSGKLYDEMSESNRKELQ